MMIASGIYGILVTALAAVIDTKLRQTCADFKINLSLPAEWIFALSRLIWSYYGWIVLIPIMILWPLVVVRILPVPQQPESRRAITRSMRYLIVLIFALTAVGVLLAMLGPILAMFQTVPGWQKR